MTEEELSSDIGTYAKLAKELIRWTGEVDYEVLAIILEYLQILFHFDHVFADDLLPAKIAVTLNCCGQAMAELTVPFIPAGMSVEVMNLEQEN